MCVGVMTVLPQLFSAMFFSAKCTKDQIQTRGNKGDSECKQQGTCRQS